MTDVSCETSVRADEEPYVSHETLGPELACSRCKAAPRRRQGKRAQRYCGPCHLEYMREWRAGWTELRVSEAEKQLILTLRELTGQGWELCVDPAEKRLKLSLRLASSR